jgi:hypothetical protein
MVGSLWSSTAAVAEAAELRRDPTAPRRGGWRRRVCEVTRDAVAEDERKENSD